MIAGNAAAPTCSIGTPSASLQNSTHTKRETAEVSQISGKIPNGSILPQLLLIAAILIGRSCMDAVLMTTKRIIPFVGLSPEFFSAIAFIAESPKGVAAFPNPKNLRKDSYRFSPFPVPFCTRKQPIDHGRKSGCQQFCQPTFSAILKNPIHAHILPSKKRTTPLLAELRSLLLWKAPPACLLLPHRSHWQRSFRTRYNLTCFLPFSTWLFLTLSWKQGIVRIEIIGLERIYLYVVW